MNQIVATTKKNAATGQRSIDHTKQSPSTAAINVGTHTNRASSR